MGRLAPIRAWHRVPKVVRLWLPPIIVVAGTIGFVHVRTFASQEPTISELQTYLKDNQLQVGEETVSNYRQVYYNLNGVIVYLTNGNSNHTAPVASGSRVVWLEELLGGKQVFVYDVLTKHKTQLSFTGSQQNPGIDGQSVVWETWTGESLQIKLHNGQTVKQISTGTNSIRPQVQGDKVAYTKRVSNNQWQIVSFTISSGKTDVLETVSGTQAYPRFVDGQIKSGPILAN